MKENVDVQGYVDKEVGSTVAAGFGVVTHAAEGVWGRLAGTREAGMRDLGNRIRKIFGFRNRMH